MKLDINKEQEILQICLDALEAKGFSVYADMTGSMKSIIGGIHKESGSYIAIINREEGDYIGNCNK